MKITSDWCKQVLMKKVPAGDIKKFLYQQLREPENFEAFCRFILPKAFTKPFASFHNEIITEFLKDTDSALGAPRGHGKSTLVGQGFILWNILYKKKKYLIYTSQNHAKSIQFLEPIRNELKNNKLIKFIYGEQIINKGKDDDNKDREDVFDVGSTRLQALSFEKNIRGLKHGNQRPDLIVLDDIEDDERVLNPELRRKDNDKLDKQIIPSLDTERGVIKFIGTILHHDSLLAKKIRSFNGKIYRACEFKNGVVDEESILFKDMFTPAKLMDIRRKIGSSSFESEYLNNPVDDTAALIKREWVVKCFDKTKSFEDPIPEACVLGVDFAFSDRVSADKSAFVALSNENKYVLHLCVTRRGMSITEQFDYIQSLHDELSFTNCSLEENSIRSMSKELKKYSFPFTLFWTGSSDKQGTISPDKFFEGKRHTVSKINMIKRLATQFENGNVVIPYRTPGDKVLAASILDELTSFALSDGRLVEVGVHPDIPIALAYAIEFSGLNNFEFDF